MKEEFHKQVEEEFWEKFFNYYEYQQHLLVGEFDALTDRLKDFHNKLDNYISGVEAKIKPFVNQYFGHFLKRHFPEVVEN